MKNFSVRIERFKISLPSVGAESGIPVPRIETPKAFETVHLLDLGLSLCPPLCTRELG